jgi:hypothetical protein
MQFRSELHIPPADWQFGHRDGVVSLGSCFAGRMGRQLLDYKFRTLVNPFGIVYHPVPLLRPLLAALRDDNALDQDLFQQNGRWRSLHFHSEISHPDRRFLEESIAMRRGMLREALELGKVLILTLGTAIGFRHKERDLIVGNCHKLPGKDFDREMSTVEVLQRDLENALQEVFRLRPEMRVLLTVSPVRHLRSGMVENSASKAVLRVVCQQLSGAFDRVDYFPAYELMLDDLRDYRFYQDDLMHPTPMAEDYIWEKFRGAYIDTKARELMERLDKVKRDLAHRPFDADGAAYRTFLQKLRGRIEELGLELDLRLELREVEERLGE